MEKFLQQFLNNFMSALINRVPTGRIISLHTELKYLYWKFRNEPFSLQEMKFDSSSKKTQLDFFPLAVNNPRYGRYKGKYDPYLDNPLDRTGFHLTQGVKRDSQKSKAASVCFDALEGLGWIERVGKGRGKITAFGKKIASLEYSNKKLLPLLKDSVLNYGPFAGFLFECLNKSKNNEFHRSDVVIGYVNTGEVIKINNHTVPLSVGSQDDSITRTRSVLVAWAMTVGYIWPVEEKLPVNRSTWHVKALELIKQKTWPWSKFKILIPPNFFEGEPIKISHPLSYRWMTKSTKALRERGQATIRNATLKMEEKVKNRRFAIVYSIALAASRKQRINFNLLVEEMRKYPKLFVVDMAAFNRVIELELKTAIISGTIFSKDKEYLNPVSVCNLDHISAEAPTKVLATVKNIALKSIKAWT